VVGLVGGVDDAVVELLAEPPFARAGERDQVGERTV